MATYIRDRSGNLQRVGFRTRQGGGFERGIKREGETLSSTERGGLARERIGRERQQLRQEYREATETRTIEEPIASTVSPEGMPSVIYQQRFIGPASAVVDGRPGILVGESRSMFGQVRPIPGASPVQRPIGENDVVAPVVQTTPGETGRSRFLSTFEAKTESRIARGESRVQEARERVIREDNFRNRLDLFRTGFSSRTSGVIYGGAIGFARTGRAIANPLRTAKEIGAGALSFARSPRETSSRAVISARQSFTANPYRFTGIALADFASGSFIERGFRRGARFARTVGKTEIPASDIVAPTYLSGEEIYPTGTPRRSVATIQREQRAFSAMPEAPSGGRGFTVLTQEEKIRRGLDLSETGGLYAAPRVSPVFTQVVTSGPSGETFSLIPRWGASGSIAEITTGAQRLPRSVRRSMRREGSIRAGNVFLDETVRSRGTRNAFSTPATELGIKTEAEVIIPGGSELRRTQNYNFFQRALGRDYEAFVRVPEYPGSRSTVPVAIRRYENIGIRPTGVRAPARGRTGGTFRASDIEYYRAPRPSSAGFLRYSPSLSGLSSSGFGSSGSVLASGGYSSGFSSGGLFSSRVTSYSSPVRSSYSSSYSRSSFSGALSYSGGYSPGRSITSSFTRVNSPFVPPFDFQGDERKRRKKKTSYRTGTDPRQYASSFTGVALGIRARRGERRATGFTGLELRGI